MTKLIFCGDFMTWNLTIWQKSKKDASTDSGLGASAQTLVLRRKIKKVSEKFIVGVKLLPNHLPRPRFDLLNKTFLEREFHTQEEVSNKPL